MDRQSTVKWYGQMDKNTTWDGHAYFVYVISYHVFFPHFDILLSSG